MCVDIVYSVVQCVSTPCLIRFYKLKYAAHNKCIIIIYLRDYMVHEFLLLDFFGLGMESIFEDLLFIAFEKRDYM